MHKNILDLLTVYCNSEMADFRCNQLYTELRAIVDELGYHLECECGRGGTKDLSNNVYLIVSVNNQDNTAIEIYDEGLLSASTELVMIDKKDRIRFSCWNNADFVDSVHWIIRILHELKCSNGL